VNRGAALAPAGPVVLQLTGPVVWGEDGVALVLTGPMVWGVEEAAPAIASRVVNVITTARNYA
jgi:hypothetical protein